jgi:hypothetical protein
MSPEQAFRHFSPVSLSKRFIAPPVLLVSNIPPPNSVIWTERSDFYGFPDFVDADGSAILYDNFDLAVFYFPENQNHLFLLRTQRKLFAGGHYAIVQISTSFPNGCPSVEKIFYWRHKKTCFTAGMHSPD